MSKINPAKITVIAPARLHMGFIDLSGSLGRHFGSIGVALNEINTELTMQVATTCQVTGQSAQRGLRCLQDLCKALNVADNLAINIKSAIPEHIGLGSGTQMSLAIGMALTEIYGLDLSVRDIAQLTYRGARSGIGIGVFEQGGLVVDGGRGKNTLTPPVIFQRNLPEDWRFILVFDERGQGLHGKQEVEAFKCLPPFPASEAQRLCYLLMMQALPAIAENEINLFGEVISQLQQSVGEHFSQAQGGVFTSHDVAETMAYLQEQGVTAIGQTSWGPTGFCALQGVERATNLLEQLKVRFQDNPKLSFACVSARGCGGKLTVK